MWITTSTKPHKYKYYVDNYKNQNLNVDNPTYMWQAPKPLIILWTSFSLEHAQSLHTSLIKTHYSYLPSSPYWKGHSWEYYAPSRYDSTDKPH